jgi:hypothetical protein
MLGISSACRRGISVCVLRLPVLVCEMLAMRNILLLIFVTLVCWLAAFGFFTLAFKAYLWGMG